MSERAQVHLRLVGMTLLWGASWPAGRVLAQAMPPVTSSAWRFTLASLVLLAWMRARQGGWPRLSPRQWLGLAAAGAVGVYLYAMAFMFTLRYSEASRAAVVVTTNPVFTTVLAAWLFGERFNARIALGLALAVAGATTVLSDGDPLSLFQGAMGLGEWLMLACIATWSAYSLMGKRVMQGVDSLSATAIAASFGCLLLWPTALVIDGGLGSMVSNLLGLSFWGWFNFFFMALGTTALAYVWFYRGIETLGAGVAASYISLVPVAGVALSVLTLGEPLEASLVLGGALAVAGVVIANRARG